MRTQVDDRLSLRSLWSVGWRVLCLVAASVLAMVVFLGLAFGRDDQGSFYAALVASIAVGPFLVLPVTRKIVWLVLASVAGVVLTAALGLVLS